jgi:chromosome segregation ATPase
MLISRRAELETELEGRDSEIGDVRLVIEDSESQLRQLNAQIQDELQENERVKALASGIHQEYKEQIAVLQLSLSKEFDDRRDRIMEMRQRLKLQKQAKKVSNEGIDESHAALQVRITELRDRLSAAQGVAVQFRDELLRAEDEQAEMADDIMGMKADIGRLRTDCDALEGRSDDGQAALGASLQELNILYQSALQGLSQAKKLIERYNGELIDQDGRIDVLARELALSKQRYQTALSAFTDDDNPA